MFKYFIALILTITAIWSMRSHATTLTQPALGSTITITTSPNYGEAITSLVFRGLQHINTFDHGRELQSAVSFDGYGECLNPTQGGSERLNTKEITSIPKSSFAFGTSIYTSSQMGYWLEPGEYYNNAGCAGSKVNFNAVNKTVTSNVLLNANYTLGFNYQKNVLTHDVTFNIPDAHKTATFEFSTVYLTKTFTKAIFFDPATGASVDAANYNREQTNPVIAYSADGKYAVGIFSKQLPQLEYGSGYGYFAFDFMGTYKLNCVWRGKNILPKSAHTFQCQYIFGTLAEVKTTMKVLKAYQ